MMIPQPGLVTCTAQPPWHKSRKSFLAKETYPVVQKYQGFCFVTETGMRFA
jgi:hypothetical protein